MVSKSGSVGNLFTVYGTLALIISKLTSKQKNCSSSIILFRLISYDNQNKMVEKINILKFRVDIVSMEIF